MRARIALRKAGVAVVPGDAAEAREMERIRKQNKEEPPRTLPVEPKDIVDALSRGDETILIIKLECVSYDHEFATELARRSKVMAPVVIMVMTPQLTRKGRGKEVNKGAPSRADSDDDTAAAFFSESEESESDYVPTGRPKRRHGHLSLPQSLGVESHGSVSDLTDYGY